MCSPAHTRLRHQHGGRTYLKNSLEPRPAIPVTAANIVANAANFLPWRGSAVEYLSGFERDNCHLEEVILESPFVAFCVFGRRKASEENAREEEKSIQLSTPIIIIYTYTRRFHLEPVQSMYEYVLVRHLIIIEVDARTFLL